MQEIFVKLSFGELFDSKLSGLYPFDYMTKWLYFIELKIGQRQKGRLWVHETSILEVILDPHWELICCNKWHPRTSRNIHTTRNRCRDIPPCATWHWNYPSIFTCWWRSHLVTTSKFDLLTIRQCSATRKHLFLYSQGDRTGLKKPKKGQASILITNATTNFGLRKLVSTDLTIKSDSVFTNLIGKDEVWGWSM